MHVGIGHAVPVHRQTRVLVHTGILIHIQAEEVLALATQIEVATSGMTGSTSLSHILGLDYPAALRYIHRVVPVGYLVCRHLGQRSAVVGTVDAHAPCPVLGADDVTVQLYFYTRIAHLGGVLLQGGVAHVGERRHHLVVERVGGQVVVVVDGTGDSAVEEREVYTEVKLVYRLPCQVISYQSAVGDLVGRGRTRT